MERIAPFAEAFADRYTIERELGHGGMATVFLATDPRHARRVAIKVLRDELTHALGAERFLREIRIAAGLAHPHILPLIDSGEARGWLYYVTPYVAGGSLRARLATEGRLSIDEALQVASQVGSALDFAHRAGFVHRDVKPENILFSDGHALLADFGIARRGSDGGGSDDATASRTGGRITEDGLVLGTPEYMSPEHAAGERTLGATADVYSLACVVYEMLAGEPPICGSTVRETMARQVTAVPRPLRVLRPEVGEGIERALARALLKDPAERFASVSAFIAALEAGTVERRAAALPASAERALAVLPFVNASGDPENEYLSDGLTDELIAALVRVQGLRVASRTSVFALKGKPIDARAIGALLDVAWVLEGTVRRVGNRLRISAQLSSTGDGRTLWAERFDRTLDDPWAIQEELARTIVETLRATSLAPFAAPQRRRYTESLAAYGLYLKGRYAWNKRTQEGVAEAIGHFEEAIRVDPAYAPAYAGLADSYALQLDYRSVPVAEGHRLAKEYARRAIALDDTVAEAHASLAWSLFVYDWEWVESQREFLRSIALDPTYATAHQWYTFWLSAHGRLDESLVEAHTALELDPASVSIRRTAGYAYLYARRYDQVRHHLTRAIAMNPEAEETYRILGLAASLQGDHAEAERVLREALRLPHPAQLTIATLGMALGRAGRSGEARAVLRTLQEAAARGYVSPVAFATVYLGLGDVQGALDWAERSIDERRGWPVYFRVNPLVDSLRGEPRFHAMMARLGL